MRNKKRIIIAIILIAILMLGIGYAAISNTTLTISGNAISQPDPENFKVHFVSGSATTSPDDTDIITASVTGDTTATIAVKGLTMKDDVATATYTIKNDSNGIAAKLSAAITSTPGENTTASDYTVSTDFVNGTVLEPGQTTTITVSVKLNKTPIVNDLITTITCTITAEPQEPAA
mgnify:CR=1 FL=1